MKINLIAVLILVGFSFGCQPLIGYNYGSKNFQRLKDTIKFAYKFEGVLAIILLFKGFYKELKKVDSTTRLLYYPLFNFTFLIP